MSMSGDDYETDGDDEEDVPLASLHAAHMSPAQSSQSNCAGFSPQPENGVAHSSNVASDQSQNSCRANRLCLDKFFRHYLVSIPADLVEIVGAIIHSDLSDIDDVADIPIHGKGRFANAMLAPCAILDAHRLHRRDTKQ